MKCLMTIYHDISDSDGVHHPLPGDTNNVLQDVGGQPVVSDIGDNL